MPLMNETLTKGDYVDVLQRLNQVVGGWEQWADRHAPDDLLEIVRQRHRQPWLQQDLEWADAGATGEPSAFNPGAIPGLEPAAEHFRSCFLGAMYVMEGSTLGGQYIARHLEKVLDLEPGAGNAYFRGYGDRTGAMWRGFKALLADVPDEDGDRVIAAAIGMFRWFGSAMVAQVTH